MGRRPGKGSLAFGIGFALSAHSMRCLLSARSKRGGPGSGLGSRKVSLVPGARLDSFLVGTGLLMGAAVDENVHRHGFVMSDFPSRQLDLRERMVGRSRLDAVEGFPGMSTGWYEKLAYG